MRFLVSILSLLLCSVSFAADIVGTWNVRNLSESMLEVSVLEDFYNMFADEYASSEYKADLLFGVLGTAKKVQFKSNGKFYVNDSVYGTYTFKNDELILKRDKKQVDAFEKSIKKTLEQKNKPFDPEDKELFAVDSLLISFSKEGNKALVEYNMSLDELKFLTFSVVFVIDKEGTKGASENLNAGKSVEGRWNMSLLGMVTYTYEFKKDGVLEIEQFDLLDSPSKKYSGKYSIDGNNITYMSDKNVNPKTGEFYVGKNGLIVCNSEGMISICLWR
ncbi:MAG: hypothetical protein MJZ19_06960 [Paludibacteraceae bacterium]|nr:hypothetical protein [Paludibacteraceae bacterium]